MFISLAIVIAIEYGGLTIHLPFLKTIRLATLLSYLAFLLVLVRVGVGDLLGRPQPRILGGLTVMTIASVTWAVVTTYVLDASRQIVDYFVFTVIVATLVDRPSRFEVLSWLFALICVFLVTINFEKLTSDVRAGAFEAGYFMGDGNDFAWGMIVALPLVLNLVLGDRALKTRLIGLMGVACCLIGVVGTSSRGAALGLAASIGFYWLLLSRRKMLGVIAIACVGAAILALAPGSYFERMKTISTYQTDNSAVGRLQAWGAAMKMAKDYPLGVGAGNFPSAYGRFYLPPASQSDVTWAPGRWLSAHSIYFRVLGEYGVIGLVLLLTLLWVNFRENMRSHRLLITAGVAAGISPTWPALLNMSLVGFAVCGVFLGGLSYPHLFLLTALTISASRLATASSIGTPSPDLERGRVQARRRPTRRSAQS